MRLSEQTGNNYSADMKVTESRMTALINAAGKTGLSLDLLYDLSLGLDDKAFAMFCGNALSMPRYSQSSGMS